MSTKKAKKPSAKQTDTANAKKRGRKSVAEKKAEKANELAEIEAMLNDPEAALRMILEQKQAEIKRLEEAERLAEIRKSAPFGASIRRAFLEGLRNSEFDPKALFEDVMIYMAERFNTDFDTIIEWGEKPEKAENVVESDNQ